MLARNSCIARVATGPLFRSIGSRLHGTHLRGQEFKDMKKFSFSDDNDDLFEVYEQDGWVLFHSCFELFALCGEDEEPIWGAQHTHGLPIKQIPELIKYLQTIANSEGE